jgi:hypothetical protein
MKENLVKRGTTKFEELFLPHAVKDFKKATSGPKLPSSAGKFLSPGTLSVLLFDNWTGYLTALPTLH